jgi:FKBP-type peptidyl-prolyl cis-trans isomerase FklB
MRSIIVALIGLLTLGLASCKSTEKTVNNDETVEYIIKDTLSYALGIVQATEMKNQNLGTINQEDYLHAFGMVISGDSALMSESQAYSIVQQTIEQKVQANNDMMKEKGEAFLAENAKRPEVTELPSGLQYEVLVPGDGPIPTASNKVTTHYTGTLIDGTIFDSSVQRGEPITFPVGGVIKGWQEALQLMPQGSKWKLYIPEDLAYGARGAGNVIPPFSALIFEIELLDIQ